MNQDWSIRMTETVMRDPQALLKWHYETGCVLKAVEQVWLKTKNDKYFAFIKEITDQLIEPNGQIKGYTIEEYNLDQINTGKILISLYNTTGEIKYEKAIKLLHTQMKNHPRTSGGGFWHKKIYPYQMWLDGLYMAAPFLAEFAKTFDEPELFDEVARQILLIEKQTRDPFTGLLYHAWDENREQRWADQETGCSPHFWGRAMGWFAMAMVDVLDYLPIDHSQRREIIGVFTRMAGSLAAFQDKSSGLWYQILDQGGREGNYPETSGSCMFIYAILKGVRMNYLEKSFTEVARKGYEGVIHKLIEIDGQGLVKLHNICGCAGLGGNPYRDGSYEYYTGEKIKINDPKGVAPFILACVEREI